MKIKYLKIAQYKAFNNKEIIFSLDHSNRHYKEYYADSNFNILVGENGSGKTTTMSFLAQIFHNLFRHHDRIPSDFILLYEIQLPNRKSPVDVMLKKSDGCIFISVDKILKESLLLEWSIRKKDFVLYEHQQNYARYVTYSQIEHFLPANVITSAFSLHGEYPEARARNYIGERIVKNYNIDKIYGSNHYKISLSRGIARFIKLYNDQPQLVNEILGVLNVKFNGRVKIFSWNLSIDPDEWISIESNLFNESLPRILENDPDNTDVYLNDILFLKDDSSVSLNNMSSGEKMFFVRMLSIMSEITDNSLVIIEEPELHLNPSWVRQIITMLQMLFGSYKAQFLIATHYYSLINTLFPENILVFDRNSVSHPNFNTFLANESEITLRLFDNADKKNYAERKLIEKIKKAKASDLEGIMEYLGESVYKFMLFKEMTKRGD